MIRLGNMTLGCCLLAASTLGLAQTPVPPPAPAPAPAPGIQVKIDPDFKFDIDSGALQQKLKDAMGKIDLQALDKVTSRLDELNFDYSERAQEFAERAQEMAERMQDKMGDLWAFAPQAPMAPIPPMPPKAPLPPAARYSYSYGVARKNSSVDTLYDRGQRALDNRAFDSALDDFTEVVSRGGARADAALYWKAYSLNKLGRRDEATASLTELRSKFPNSRWMDDAKALEIEVKQSAGQKVAPESQSDDELKLLALNGLAQSDPDRAIPILERLLHGAQQPRVKKEAIFVLASNSSPKAQQELEQIARGGGNPDLQVQAIQYFGRTGKQANRGQLLLEIYNSSSDLAVKHAVLNGLASARDKDRLLQIAHNGKNTELHLDAIRMVASSADQAELSQLYASETDPAAKLELLRMLAGHSEKVVEIARSEKDVKLRRTAIEALASVKSAYVSDALVSLYGSESDAQAKRIIINVLANQRNVQGLITLGRKETDLEMKRSIVRAISSMHSPEAASFLEEILK